MEGEDVTEWFKAANLSDDKEFDNVTLTKMNVTQIKVSYKSGRYSSYLANTHRFFVLC